MHHFYEDVIGLELMRRFDGAAFFRIADGFAGHTAVLALFARGTDVAQEHTPLDHLAFTISLEDFETEKARLEGLGLDVFTAEHDWVHWRSLYVNDPEGNLVELVCFDESVR
jgi:catechol-2,3-dioxygenase